MKMHIMKKVILLLALAFIAVACDKDEEGVTPGACFSVNSPQPTIYVGDPVEFINCSTDAESYSWDFGDGSTSTEKDPTHAFDESKTFEVVLVVYGGGDHPKSDTTKLPITVWKAVK